MKKQISLTGNVSPESSGRRLDQVAAEMFSAYSRSMLKRWIENAMLTVNGKSKRPRDKVYVGDILAIEALMAEPDVLSAQPMVLNKIFEDEHIVVIGKPAGLVVHPAAGNPEGTLLNGLLYDYPFLSAIPRAGIVHRLDKDTTGLMVIAKNLEAHASLVQQLQNRTVKRQYVAIANGMMTSGGKVDQPIGRHPYNRLKMAVTPNGKSAITHYRILQRFQAHTLLRLNLETGRTHQIRVHMSHIHHPLVGDAVYGARNLLPKGAGENLIQALRQFGRQALHAERLGLLHPVTREYMEWNIPMPDDLIQLLNLLKADVSSYDDSFQ